MVTATAGTTPFAMANSCARPDNMDAGQQMRAVPRNADLN
jgi:hypothetical protein